MSDFSEQLSDVHRQHAGQLVHLVDGFKHKYSQIKQDTRWAQGSSLVETFLSFPGVQLHPAAALWKTHGNLGWTVLDRYKCVDTLVNGGLEDT